MQKMYAHEQLASPGLMPVWDVIKKWKKEIIAFVLISVVIALAICFSLPKKYYSATTILPSNPLLTDKGRLFNKNIEQLYSIYGTGDDLDRLEAMATTQSMYQFISDSFKLIDPNADATQRHKRILKLKRSIDIRKTSNGELVIGVWTKDRNLSAKISNAVVERLKQLSYQALLEFNTPAIGFLKNKIAADSSADSLKMPLSNTNYREALNEVMTSIETAPVPFIITDKAIPSVKAGKPRFKLIVASVFLFSLLFAMLAAIVIERSRKTDNDRQVSIS